MAPREFPLFRGFLGNSVGQATLPSADMDDRTLNLWRQIESCRRRGRSQIGNRTKPATPSPPQKGS